MRSGEHRFGNIGAQFCGKHVDVFFSYAEIMDVVIILYMEIDHETFLRITIE